MEFIETIVLTNLIFHYVLMVVLAGILIFHIFDRKGVRQKGIITYVVVCVSIAIFIILDTFKYLGVEFPNTFLWVNPVLAPIIGSTILWNSYYVKGRIRPVSFMVFAMTFIIALTEVLKIISGSLIYWLYGSVATFIATILLYYIIINFLTSEGKRCSFKRKACWRKIIYLIIGVSAVGLLILGATKFEIFADDEKLSSELRIYNWEDYFDESVLENFEKEFGVKVSEEYFEDESLILGELNRSPDKYDLVIASDNIVKEMIGLGLLSTIRGKNIPNLKYISKKCVKENMRDYAVPYFWGTTGLAINTKYIPEDTNSWNVLWNKGYAGKISVLNNPDEVFGMSAKYIGLPLIPQSTIQFKEVEKFLLNQKPLVKDYAVDIEIRDNLISEEIWAAQIYGGLARMAANENRNIKYILPKEGGSQWIDNFVILKNSKNRYTAEVFINYIHQPEIKADIAKYQEGYSCNENAMDLLGKDFLKEISEDQLRFFEYFSDYYESEEVKKLKEELWDKLIGETEEIEEVNINEK